ncbi:MAG TPA: RDD family protein, partial [Streptosporangiaceae bacterium]|nr:RDD family protein [Streptosporangiaceae bacterium]
MAEVVTGEAVVLEVPCARFPSRMLALAIDLAIQLTIIAVLLTVVALGAADHSMNTAEVTAIVVTVLVLALIGYPVAWEAATRGRTPGKLALGLRVVGDDGSPERFRQALVRGLATLVDFWLVPFIGVPALICSLLSAKGKRLGDVFAGTFVIQHRLPARRRAAPPIPIPPELAAWASGLELSGLTDQTAAMARLYLGRLPDLTPGARAELGERISAAVRAQVSPPPPPGTPVPPYLAAVLAERHRREHARLMAPGAPGVGPGAPPGAAAHRWAPPGAATSPWASPGTPVPRPEPASRWAAPEPPRSPAPEWTGTAGEGE